MKPNRWAAGAVVVLLATLGWVDNSIADVYVRDDIIVNPVPGPFSVCHGHSCTLVSTVSLNDEQWGQIAGLFAEPAEIPGEERAQIAGAIALFETIVGKLTGTADDKPENQSDRNWQGQMDCIDESTNTTTYLKILAGAGLLKWHKVENRATRSLFLFFYPHTTAVVRDLKTNKRWAVDSWFFANGEPPVIIRLGEWKRGWNPEENASPSEVASRPRPVTRQE